jgi:diguanylate cyclase (GGDEF)-like protein
VPTPPGAAASLCWVGAALAFVHGLRQRARRPSRIPLLAAIWGATSFASAFIADLSPFHIWLAPQGAPIFAALGLFVAGLVVGPRAARAAWLDWLVLLLLCAIGIADIAVSMVASGASTSAPIWADISLLATAGYVAVGITVMLLLNEDLIVALERLARTDALTGIWNRRGFDEAAPHLLSQVPPSWDRALASVAIADIDSFKSVNDRFGHTTGDAVLVDFARRLEQAVEKGDLLARLGGEEFVLLAIGVDGPTLLSRVETVRQAMSLTAGTSGGMPTVTASFGVAQIYPGPRALRDGLERADQVLYRAKQQGRNRSILDSGALRNN